MPKGRVRTKVCKRGHNMTETRRTHPNGDTYCYACKLIRYKESRENNPEKHKEYRRKSRIKIQYGISIEEYNNLHVTQNGSCAICNKALELQSKRTHIDHDHKTGRVRGMLCHQCNTGIGLFREDVKVLQKAINYIEMSKAGMNKKKKKK